MRLRILTTLSVLLVCAMSVAQQAEQSQLDFANGLFGRGFYDDAATEYRTYLDKFPEGANRETALYRLGESLYAQKDYAGASDTFGNVIAQFPNGNQVARSLLRQGVSLYRTKRYKEAQPKLIDVGKLNDQPELKSEALYYLGKLYTDKQQWAPAIKAYEQLIKDTGKSSFAPFGRYQLAAVYVAQNKFETAAVLYMEVGENTTLNESLQMDALYRAGEAYDSLGWHEAAAKSYGKLKERFPGSSYAQKADYGMAWSLYRSGSYDEAQATIDAFTKNHPKSALRPGLDYLKGNCLLKQKKYPEAEALFQSVMTQYPDMPFAQQARYKLAVSLMERGDSLGAKTHLTALTQQSGKSALVGDASFLLGTLLMGTSEFSNASLQFLRVVEQYPNSEFAIDSQYKLGECYALSGELAKSAETFEAFARTHKASPLALEAVFHSADAYFQLGRFEDALVRFQHVAADGKTSAFREEALYRVAIAYHNLERREDSIATFQRLLDTHAESQYAAEARYRIGDYLLFEKKDAVAAMEHFVAVGQRMPANAFTGRAHKGIAVAHYEMKDFDGAVEAFYRVITNFPELSLQSNTYEWVGQHLFDRGEWNQCQDVFKALLDRVPNYDKPEQIRLKLGDTLTNLEQYDAALSEFTWVRENKADTVAAHEASFRTAKVLEKQGKREDAVALYESVASATMNDTAARARFRLGELFESSEDYDTAAKHFMRVAILFLHPELSPESLWRAGQCYEKGENVSSALKIYRDIVAEYPDTEQATQAGTRLIALKG